MSSLSTNKAFFLDRDGTINVDTDFVHKPEEWEFCDGAVESIKWMNEEGFKVIVVTNQSGVARGHFDLNDVMHLHHHVDDLLAKHNARIDAWYICPYHPEFTPAHRTKRLRDRKPETGMFDKAIRRFNIDPTQSFMAGDKVTDLKPAIELGMKPFYIKSRFHSDEAEKWLEKHYLKIFDNLGNVTKQLGRNHD